MYSMIACVRPKLNLGEVGNSKIRYVIQGGAKTKRYVSLHRGEGGQKWPKLALRNFWTAPITFVRNFYTPNLFIDTNNLYELYIRYHNNIEKNEGHRLFREFIEQIKVQYVCVKSVIWVPWCGMNS